MILNIFNSIIYLTLITVLLQNEIIIQGKFTYLDLYTLSEFLNIELLTKT